MVAPNIFEGAFFKINNFQKRVEPFRRGFGNLGGFSTNYLSERLYSSRVPPKKRKNLPPYDIVFCVLFASIFLRQIMINAIHNYQLPVNNLSIADSSKLGL
jgi:hypothetical protein